MEGKWETLWHTLGHVQRILFAIDTELVDDNSHPTTKAQCRRQLCFHAVCTKHSVVVNCVLMQYVVCPSLYKLALK